MALGANVKLSNGAEVTYNWDAISQKEWRALLDQSTDEESNDIIVGKIVGMTADELSDLSPVEYRKVSMGLFESFKQAIDTSTSKNSAGASTSD
jgi:hypothetical protein